MQKIVIALACTLLFGCSQVDDPENVPQLGEWEISWKLASVQVGSVFLKDNELPKDLQALGTSQKFCGEPRFASQEATQKDLDKRFKGKCVINDYEATATSLRGSGKCKPISQPLAEYYPDLRIQGDVSADSYRMIVVLDGITPIEATGRREQLKVIAKVEGRRLGDC